MIYYGTKISRLVEELSQLPGVGGKSAQRMAFHILRLPTERAESLAEAILDARHNVKYCSQCMNLSDTDPCHICADRSRDHHTIMVVEDPRDMAAYEKIREYRGTYHVLHGAISPTNGVGPNEIRIKELLARVQQEDVEEIILATNPNVEGEATAMYISKLIKPLDIKVTRIAHGVPVGGDLEYVGEVTLAKALEGRREM